MSRSIETRAIHRLRSTTIAYVPPDPSQPLPEEPDTQDLEDEYANVRDALAA